MRRLAWVGALSMACIACGDDGGDSQGQGATNAERLVDSTSASPNCASLRGATAVYFDFESGFPVNLPFVPLLQSTAGVITGGDGSLWSFPPGYLAQAIPRGVTIQREDGQVFFKHTTGERLLTDPATAFGNQLQAALATFGLGDVMPTLICAVDRPFSVGPLPGRLIVGLYEAGSQTLLVKIQVIDATGLLSLNTKVAAGPTEEFDALAGNVFLPMVWAQFPGGSGPQPQCSDGMDNDGDLLIDFGIDPGCDSREDDDERNP